ncbi:MAG: hypothetical protein Q7T55_10610 [Solirubrobacteraceae bacterium]|nr:hypothetical protein [Solirubrobacteraceae bacterium]
MSNAASSSTSAPRLARVAIALAAGVVVSALAIPASASAAGFGAPVKISGKDDLYTDPMAVMAPSGRTALLYGRGRGQGTRLQYRLALGDSADRLSAPRTLTLPGTPAGARFLGAELLARTDGTFVLCLTRITRTGKSQGCSIAPPGQSFGALATLPGPPTSLRAIARPDGTTVLLRTNTRSTPNSRVKQVSSTMLTLDASGRPGPERPFVRTKDEFDFNLSFSDERDAAVLTDGTIAIRANYPDPKDRDTTRLGIRLMAPGADAFGPIVPVPGILASNDIALVGGPVLTVSYRTTEAPGLNGPDVVRAVQRRPDGTFGPTLTVPGPQPRSYEDYLSAALGVQPDGGLFTVTARTEPDPDYPDCDFLVSGAVSTGAFTPVGQPGTEQVLSDPKQIALQPQAASLADGTAIAAWQEGLGESGLRRVVVAIRPAGATSFNRPRRLPQVTASPSLVTLLAAGEHAALVWQAEDRDHSVVVSTLRSAPPYAAFVPPARHPGTSCE